MIAATKFAEDGGASLFAQMQEIGLRQNVVPAVWTAWRQLSTTDVNRIRKTVAPSLARDDGRDPRAENAQLHDHRGRCRLHAVVRRYRDQWRRRDGIYIAEKSSVPCPGFIRTQISETRAPITTTIAAITKVVCMPAVSAEKLASVI